MLNGNYKIDDCVATITQLQQKCFQKDEKKVTTIKTTTDHEAKENDKNVLVSLFGYNTVSISFNNKHDTVSTIKRKVEDISGYPSKLIQLKIGTNTIYDNNAKMNQFNIKNDDILQAMTYNTNTWHDKDTIHANRYTCMRTLRVQLSI